MHNCTWKWVMYFPNLKIFSETSLNKVLYHPFNFFQHLLWWNMKLWFLLISRYKIQSDKVWKVYIWHQNRKRYYIKRKCGKKIGKYHLSLTPVGVINVIISFILYPQEHLVVSKYRLKQIVYNFSGQNTSSVSEEKNLYFMTFQMNKILPSPTSYYFRVIYLLYISSWYKNKRSTSTSHSYS